MNQLSSRSLVSATLAMAILFGGLVFPLSPSSSSHVLASRSRVAQASAKTGLAPLTAPRGETSSQAQAPSAYGNGPVYFEANRGQVDARANFIARQDRFGSIHSHSNAECGQ